MAKIALLALAIVLVLTLGRALRLARMRSSEKAKGGRGKDGREKLAMCKACGSYYPDGEECGCGRKNQ